MSGSDSTFSPLVHAFWLPSEDARRPAPATTATPTNTPTIAVVDRDDALPDDRGAQYLDLPGATGVIRVNAAYARLLGLSHGQTLTVTTLRNRARDAGLTWNGADLIHYVTLDDQRALEPERGHAVRPLTDADADAFAAFTAAAPEDDVDEAFVELDHWVIVGAFDGDRLVGAASMYPWQHSQLADIGVISLPEERGKGIGRALVRRLAADALQRGYEPQYRCQPDNAASVGLARSAGFTLFARWDVIDSDASAAGEGDPAAP